MAKDDGGKVWVTGATGFIGQAVINALHAQGRPAVPISHATAVDPGMITANCQVLGDLASLDNPDLLRGVDCILHLAGRAHIQKAADREREDIFMRANRDTTRALARAAAQAGVRRFVLLSSIGVLGNNSGEHPFNEESPVAPHNAYTRSKLAAEQELWRVTREEFLEGVVLRSPLVYGPNPKGNLSLLMRAIQAGIPLPLGAVHNRRSFIALDNLVHALIACINAPEAANELFLVSDREVVSTTEFIRRLAQAMDIKARLLAVPSSPIYFTAKLFGRYSEADQLLGNLEIDSSKIRHKLNWRPPFTFEQGLLALAQDETRRQ